MAEVQTTIVVVPRERFADAVESVESVLATASTPCRLVYVDAGSPPAVARQLAEAARRLDFTLLRTDRYLTPNQARNMALPMVTTTLVAFLDNDVYGAPGWLAALERCAAETGADIVAPLTCIGRPVHSRIHHAGGISRFIERDGRRLFEEAHNLNGEPFANHRRRLARERTGMAEFHCVMVRADVFKRHGKLDEKLLSSHEHLDLCLTVAAAGGKIYFEPESVVTYVPDRLAAHELPYFMLRWSDEWSRRSLEHFFAKWNARDVHDDSHSERFVWHHRGYGLPRLRKRALAVGGWRFGNLMIGAVEKTLAGVARRRFPGVGQNIPFNVVHASNART